MDWRTRARRLDIPDYQAEIAPDGKLLLDSDQFEVIMPDNSSSAEEFGRIYLWALRRSYNFTQDLLGRPAFDMPDTIKEEFVINLSSTGLCCGPESDGIPLDWNAGTYDEYQQMINLESPNTEYLKTADWAKLFNGNHELTHRFVYGLDLSPFLNEGLAEYAQDHGEPQPMDCGVGGYNESDQFTHYTYLCTEDMNRYYNSGDCFWQRVEAKYGPGTVKRIIAKLYNKTERDSMMIYYPNPDSPTVTWHSFSGETLIDLNQAFVPVIGKRFWSDFRDFGFSPTMADNVTYDSEMASAGCS